MRRLPPFAGEPHVGCLNCGPKPKLLNLDRRVAVGFGDAHVSRNNRIVFFEHSGKEYTDCPTVRTVERWARAYPKADWRIVLHGPLNGATYQRQGRNRWVMVESNEGFA